MSPYQAQNAQSINPNDDLLKAFGTLLDRVLKGAKLLLYLHIVGER